MDQEKNEYEQEQSHKSKKNEEKAQD